MNLRKRGLACVSDEALAVIVENSIDEYGELKGEAVYAFEELVRRNGK